MKEQTLKSLHYLRRVIEEIPQETWDEKSGGFLNVQNLAIHTIVCMDFYFTGTDGEEFDWSRYGGGRWWLSEYPERDRNEVLTNLDTVLDRVSARFDAIPPTQVVYANQHTLYHIGQLTAVLRLKGANAPLWEDTFG